jgi:hypothetical protein
MKALKLVVFFYLLIIMLACAAPSKFEVRSLSIIPSECMVGEKVKIMAEVSNVGGQEGIYTAMLKMNGVIVSSSNITVNSAAPKAVSFDLITDKSGTHDVSIDNLHKTLIVKPQLRKVELKYDSGLVTNYLVMVEGGHLISYIPPAVPFIIKTVRVAGALETSLKEPVNFDLEIWDKNNKVIYKKTYPYTTFTHNSRPQPAWKDFDIPDISVTDSFYIHLFTNSTQGVLHIGADDSIKNEHSDVTVKDGQGNTIIPTIWPFNTKSWWGDKSKVNWLIRVVGIAPVQ